MILCENNFFSLVIEYKLLVTNEFFQALKSLFN